MNSQADALPTLPLCPLAERYTYHVLTAAACMPASNKFGTYRKVAAVEVDHHERPLGYVPERIAEIRGVRFVYFADRLNVGTTDQCAYAVALNRANDIADNYRAERAREASEDASDVVELRAVG